MNYSSSVCAHFFAYVVLLCSIVTPTTLFAKERVLQFGVLPYTSPVRLAKVFSSLKNYLEVKLDRTIEISTAPNYQKFVAHTNSKYYDIVMTAPHFALLAQRTAGYKPLARFSGDLYGVVLVKPNSRYKTIADLRGKTIATPDRLAIITLLGEELFANNDLYWPGDIRYVAKNSHTSAGLATVIGETDASILYFPAYKKYTQTNPVQSKLKVLAYTRSVPHAMFIAKGDLPEKLSSRLKTALLTVAQDKWEGREFLDRSGFENIVNIEAGDSESLERYLKVLVDYLPENGDD